MGNPSVESVPSTLSEDIYRWLTVLSALAVAGSYLLPWSDIVGPTAPADARGEQLLVALSTGPESASLSAYDIAVVPEVVVGFTLLSLIVAVLRWSLVGQILSGVLGLMAAGAVLFLWAFIDVDDPESRVELGAQTGPATSFEPGIGLWVALFASLAIVVWGFGGAARTYVHAKESEMNGTAE
jgi:hypothetical protein